MELFQDQRVYLQQPVNSCRLPVSLNSCQLVECREPVLCGMPKVQDRAHLVLFITTVCILYAVYTDSPQLSMRVGR